MYEIEWNCYTYLIGWSQYNKWYYGVRYKKGCVPSELWKKYFTSSEYVKKYRKEYGEPDIIQVRKTFGRDVIKAQIWERKVITRMKCSFDDKWLNRGNWGIDFNPSPEKRKRSDECKRKISEKRREWESRPENKEVMLRVAATAREKGKLKVSEKAKKRFQDKEWYNNVYRPSIDSEKYRTALGERTKKAYLEGRMQKYYDAINSDEYREKQSISGKKVMEDLYRRENLSKKHKKRLSDPIEREKMSIRSKQSTELRLQRRKDMKELREKIKSGYKITIEDAKRIGCKSVVSAYTKLKNKSKH